MLAQKQKKQHRQNLTAKTLNEGEHVLSIIYTAENIDRRAFVAEVTKICEPKLDNVDSIFVKPNIVSSEHYPTTTHPEMLDALLDRLAGKKVIVGDAPAVDTGFFSDIVAESPLKEVCDSHGVSIVNLYKTKMHKWTSPRGYSMRLSSLPLKCDYTISLPVLKVQSLRINWRLKEPVWVSR